jgi:hypothetical protein
LAQKADGWQRLSDRSPTIIFGYIPVLPFCPPAGNLHFNYPIKKECKKWQEQKQKN